MDTQTILKLSENLFINWGYPLVLVSSFIETTPFGFLIPGSLIVSAGGYYSYSTPLNIGAIIMFGSLGMLTTFMIAYYLGYKTGYSVVKLFNQQKNSDRAKKLLENHGAVILTTALMANTTRFWVAYISGAQKYSFKKFLFYAIVSSISWNAFLASVGYFAGTERFAIEKGLAGVGIFSYVLVIIFSLLIARFIKKQTQEI